MACRTERSISIGDFVSGHLAPEHALELLDHVETCLDCSRELDLAAGMVAAADKRGAAAFARPGRRRWLLLAAAAAGIAVVGLYAWNRFDDVRCRRALVELASLEPIAVSDVVLRGADGISDPGLYRAAIERYAAGDFAAAETKLADLLADAPENPLFALYLGVARLQVGKAAEALAPLETAAARGEDLVQERALWYLASARLALADGPGAIEILERLVARAGDYEPNARDKLSAVRAALDR